MNILQNIFNDYFDEIQYLPHIRSSVLENVQKMIHCGDPSFGGAMFGCPKCGTLKFVPFRCHSKFCPTCGNMYSIDRTTAMSFKSVNISHRHCVFTISENLRPYFLQDRSLLNSLFSAVRSVVLRMFHKENKSELFTPGFICVLHTFGRDLKWNPHIHCLISEGGLGNSGLWRNRHHFIYTFLRNAFRTALLNLFHHKLGDPFKKEISASYKNNKHGFYVYAKPNKCHPSHILKYGRYLGRPVIATFRINSYDGDFVTFYYNRHKDDKLITEHIPAMEFIERLIQHIPEKHFKMIRYYGLYVRHRASDKYLVRAMAKEKHAVYLSMNEWRTSILLSFGYDPLKCFKCNTNMTLLELYHKHQRIPLHKIYKKVMTKHRGCRSSAPI